MKQWMIFGLMTTVVTLSAFAGEKLKRAQPVVDLIYSCGEKRGYSNYPVYVEASVVDSDGVAKMTPMFVANIGNGAVSVENGLVVLETREGKKMAIAALSDEQIKESCKVNSEKFRLPLLSGVEIDYVLPEKFDCKIKGSRDSVVPGLKKSCVKMNRFFIQNGQSQIEMYHAIFKRD